MANRDGFWSSRKEAKNSGPVEKPRKRRRPLGFMPLEPRIMYDGAGAATAAHQHHDAAADAAHAGGPGQVAGVGTAWHHDASTAAAYPGAPPPATASGPNEGPPGAAWHHDAAPTSSTPGSSPVHDVVFIDSQVPDLQDLLNGVKPGERVFVLNSNQDGLQQIAGILAANGLDNLSAISIVGHGLQGEFTIGSTDLTDASLASEASALAAIGKSLKPGGDLLLYGCDVAQGAAGQQFISDLSAYAGGAIVAASTQNIGTLQGSNGGFENWSLDASTGPIHARVPFTAAALASYEGLLANTTLTASSITTTLTTDADHDGGISPGDTVTSTVTITNTTGNAANNVTLSETASGLTPGSVVITPIAVNDSYSLVGNTPITVNAANGVLANDIDFNGDALTAGSAVNVTNGSVTLNSDGSFTFTPTTGFAGTASFQYNAHDAAAGNSDTLSTVTLTVTAPVWYVDSANTGSQDGSLAHPFTTIAAAVTAAATDTAGGNGVNNTIFVENAGTTYSGSPITLANGEQLLGDGSSLTQVNGNSVGLSSTNPTFSVSSASAAVTLGLNNTISGINITNTSTGDGIENSGSIGTFTMSNVGVTTKSGTGVALTGGGTVDAIGSGNTINASTGTALDVENTTIGSANLIFKSISSGTGGNAANDGIILINTGSSGGLIVTGDGSSAFGGDGSGGTIESKTGADGSTTSGIGIYLDNTSDVSFDDMTLSSFGNFAIRGFGVNNFTFENSTISGQSGQNLDAGGKPTYEGTIAFGSDGSQSGGAVQNGLTGAATISNSNIGFGLTDVLYIYDNSGTLNRLTITGNTFGGINDVQNAFGANEVFVEADGTSVIDATVTNNTLTSSAGDGFFADVIGSASMDVAFDNNIVGNSAALPLQGSDSVELSDTSTGTVTYDISNDTITNAVSTGILAVLSGNGTKMSGTINDDTIGSSNANATGSGSQFDGIDVKIEKGSGTSTTAITNNSIYHFGEDGINLLADNGSSTLNATVTGNKIMDPDGNFPFAGVELDSGALGTDGNNINMTLGSATNGLLQNTFTFNSTLENTDGYTPVFLQTLGTSKIAVSQAGSGSNTADGVVESDNIFTPLSNTAEVADSQAGGPISETSGVTTTPASLGLSPTLTAAIIPTTATEGTALTDTGAVGDSHTSSINYQWQENFGSGYVNIAGATSTGYTPTEADVGATLRLVATSTDSSGLGTESISNVTGAVADHLTFTATPSFTSTTTQVGHILMPTAATTDNADATITYKWETNSGSGSVFTPIAGATGLSYRPTAADAGATLELVVTATDPHGGNISTTVVDSTPVAAFTAQALSNVSLGTLPGNDKVTLTWLGTVSPQSNGLITNPSYTGNITGSNLSPSPVAVASTVTLDTLTLGGEIFQDLNGNGLLDSGESGISGVSLSVFAQGTSTVLETTSTVGNGDYSFTGLAAGSYVVEVNASNFQSGGPLANFSNSSAVAFDPNNYVVGQNAGNPKSAGVVDTKPITIAYDAPHPSGATTYPGDDTTNTLDVGFVSGPAIGGAGTTVDYYQNGTAQAVDTGLTLSDPTNANITSATVSITDAGNFVPGDVLAFTPQFGITGSYNTATGVLTLQGSDTAAHYQSVLDSLTYSFVGDPTVGGTEHVRTVSYQVTDATNLSSAAVTSTVDTFAPPAISLGAATVATFIQGGGSPVTLDHTGISIIDPNALTTLSSATVALGAGFVTGLDTLSVASSLTGTGITASYDANSGVLTLSGTSSITNYTTALENVQFNTSSTSLASRTVTWTVNDDAGGHNNPSGAATSSIAVVHADSAPVLSGLGNSVSTTEPAAVVLEGTGTVTVADADLDALNNGSGDYSGASLTIARSAANPQDAFAFAASASFTVTGNELQAGSHTFATFSSTGGTLQISFTGSGVATTALVNDVMQHITYADHSTSSENVTLNWTFNDGDTNGAQGINGPKVATGTTTVDVTANNQPPAVTVPGTQSDVENTPLTFSTTNATPNAISISDTSIGSGNDTVTLSVADGTLSLASTAGLTSFTNDSASVTLTGTIANINADLNGLTYNPNPGFTSSDTLHVTASDPGTTLSGTGTVTITVAASTSSITATQTTTTDADGDVAPGDNVTTTVVVTNTGGSDASGVSFSESQNGLTQTGTVEVTPVAANDSYTLAGNTAITVDALHGVLANDIDVNGDTPTVSKVNGSAANVGTDVAVTGGTLKVAADGSFTFTPTTGFAGTVSFQYTAHNAAGDSDQTATVTLTVTAPVWYVNSAAASGGDGSSANPFQTVDAAVAAAANDTNAGAFSHGVNNTIMVENGGATYSELNPITLANGERLLGSGDPTISVNSSSAAILLASNNTISGIDIINTGTGDGIENSGAIGTLTMSNIVVTTGSGTGIALVGGSLSSADVVDVTGSGNIINASTGTALDIENTNIGSGNVIFTSISSGTGGSAADDGIILVNTGSSGGLIVTGDGGSAFGGDGTGGTIEGKTGADGSTTSGIGIYLDNTSNVSFDDMQLNDFGNFAIRGISVNNFTFANSTISGQSGQNLDAGGKPTNEGTIVFGSDGSESGGAIQNGLTGTATISNSKIGFGLTDVLYIYDNSGTLNRLTVTGNTFGGVDDAPGAFGTNEVFVEAAGTSAIDATVTNNTFTSSAQDGFSADVADSANMDLVFDNNTVGNSATTILGGTDSVELSDDSSGTVTYDISGNIITNAASAAILADLTGNGTTMSGTIDGNTIGSSDPAATGSGSQFDGIDVKIEGGSGTSTTAITNNSIYHFGEDGINLLADNGSSTLNATVTGNTISNPDVNSFAGLELDSGALSGDSNNINITVGDKTNTLLQNTFMSDTSYVPVSLNTQGSAHITVSQAGSGSGTADGVIADDNIFTPSNPTVVVDSGVAGSITETASATTTPGSLGLSPTLTQPTISATPEEGVSLSATAAVGDSLTSHISYQWQENFGSGYVNIAGATGTSYTPLETDVGATLRLVATSIDSTGLGTQAISSPTGTVLDNLTFTSTPVISGIAEAGQLLTATAATADNGDATISYQWKEDVGSGFVAIAGATGLTYRPTTADANANATLELVATANDPHGGVASTTVIDPTPVAAFNPLTLSSLPIGTLPAGKAVTITWHSTVDSTTSSSLSNHGTVSSNFGTVNTNTVVTRVDQPPVNTVPGPQTTLENTSLAITGLSVADQDGDPASADITVTLAVGGGKLTVLTGVSGGLSAADITGNGTDSVTLTGSQDTIDATLAAANGVVYVANAASPDTLTVTRSDTLTMTSSDDGRGGVASDVAITVIPVNQPPTDTNQTIAVLPTGSHIFTTTDFGFPNAGFLDPNGNNLQAVEISSLPTAGSLTDNGIAVAAGQFVSLADITGGHLVFTPGPGASAGPYTTFTFQVQDDGGTANGGVNLEQTPSTMTVDVSSVPIIANANNTVIFDQGGNAVAVDGGAAGIKVIDPNNPTLTSATVTIANAEAGDTLSFTNTDSATEGNIAAAGSGSQLMLSSLGNTATLAQWDAALEAVTYNSTSADPTVGGTVHSRTVTWSVTDTGNLTSATADSTVDVIGLPAIVVTPTPAVTFHQNGGAIQVDGTTGITVSDPNNVNIASATVSLGSSFVPGDTLGFTGNANTGNITVGTSSGNALVLISSGDTATLAQWDAALQAVTYNSTSVDPTLGGTEPSRTVTWSVTDADNQTSQTNAAATSTFNVVGIPSIAGTSNTVTFVQNGSAVAVDGANPGPGISVSDPNNATLTSATVSFGGSFQPGDTLSFTNTSSTTEGNITAATGPNGELDLTSLGGTATLLQWDAALQAVTYSFTGDPTIGGTDHSRTVTWTVTDADNQASANATSTVDVIAFPTIAVTPHTVAFYQNGSAVAADGTSPTIAISDPNNVPIASATVNVNFGGSAVPGDTLSFTNTDSTTEGNITVGTSSGNELVLISQGNTATLSQWQAALGAVTYNFTAGDPTDLGTEPSRTVTWSVTDADSQTSQTSATNTITVFAQPIVTPSGANTTFTTGGGPVLADPHLTVTDYNGTTLASATVTISDAQIGDTLSETLFTDSGNILVTPSSGGQTLTLTAVHGTDSINAFIQALDDVQFSTTSTNFGARTITWTVNDEAGGQTNNSAGATSHVTFDSVSVTGTAQEGRILTATPLGDPNATVTYQWQRSINGTSNWVDIGSPTTANTYTVAEADEGNHLRVEATFADSGNTIVDSAATATVINNPPAFTAVVGQPVNDGKVELQGTGENGEMVNIYADGNTTTPVGTGFVSPNGTFDITTTATFTEGPHTFTATETNVAVNLTSTVSTPAFPVIVDPTAPVITTVVGQALNGATVELQGTGEAGETVNLFADGGTTIVGTGTVGPNGTFDITTTVTFLDGVHSFTATETDSTHLTSTASTPAFTVDVDPTAPVITAVVGQPLNGGTVELKGTGEAGDTINIFVNGNPTNVVNATVQSNGTFDITTTATFSNGVYSFTATETDGAHLTSTASTPAFPVNVIPPTANLAPPPSQHQAGGQIPDNFGHGQFGDFSAMVTNANLKGGDNFFNDFSAFQPDVYVVHTDVHATIADNGAITFGLPLSELDGVLGGDVVSLTATLAGGRPLPAWLHFDGHTGQFAGLLPENNATGSIGPDGGDGGQPHDPNVPAAITIEVVARDSKGNLAITEFTIDISELKRHSGELKRHGGEQHGWNLSPGDGFVDPFATNRRGRDHVTDLAPGSHRELAPLHAMDRVLWHDVATFDIGRVHGDHGSDHTPAGRTGLSDQIKTLGWHAAAADRMALLESLRQGVAGWR
jgi:hypothetical protein